jgi:hypothetical protein
VSLFVKEKRINRDLGSRKITNENESNAMTVKFMDRPKSLPELRNAAPGQQNDGSRVSQQRRLLRARAPEKDEGGFSHLQRPQRA